jgi:hypothetical protein|tara:strand:- start:12022 stop:12174 length:153 start_codon:yes stop_codon:yes gene_type:complete
MKNIREQETTDNHLELIERIDKLLMVVYLISEDLKEVKAKQQRQIERSGY